MLDFNPTPLRKEFSFAREQPEIAAALANPDDTGLLIEAAKQQNLFQLSGGRLSLLPPEIANPTIGEISDEAVKAAAAQLRSGKEEPKAEIDLPGGKGKVSFKVTEGMVQTAHVAWVETTISRDGAAYTHTSLLSLGEEEPIPAGQKIEEFIGSGLFERDLLLAKAEFMEHADRSQFADLAKALQPALKEVSYADRALLLNFMVGMQGRAYTLEILRQPPEQQIASAQDLLKALKNHPEIFDTIPLKANPEHLDAIAKVLNGNLAIIETRYNTHIRSALTDKSPSERALALNFLAHPSCKPYLERILKSDDPGLVAPAMDKVIRAMQANPQEIVAAMGTYPEIARMMGSRFAESDHFRYMDSWIELAGKTDPEEFKEYFSTFKTYSEEAIRIQADRPKIYSSYDFALSMEQLERGETNIITMRAMLSPIASVSRFLDNVISEIQDSTLVSNTQMIHENIHCFLTPPDFSARTFPSLERRYSHSLALSREFHPDLTLYADSEDEVDFRTSTDLAITNEKTMETRRMRLELPFSGRMTVTRARKLLMVLEETVKSPTEFDKAYEKAGLESADKERIKKAFTEWEAKSTEELGKVLFDFNATETRPVFTYVRENPRMATAISNPRSLSNALEAASGGNIFLMKNGRLSLLPEEIPQPKMGQIDPIELGSAVEALLKSGKADLTLPKRLTGQIFFETGELSFSHYQEQVDEIQIVWLETKIARGSETITRKTAYILREGETASAKLEEIANSGQFERDLLLAKAEFIDAHV